MVKNKNEIVKILDEYIQLANKPFYIKKAYLFGSYAKGTPNKYSDIDIALISDDFNYIPEDRLLKILFRLARQVDTSIEPVALTPKEIEKPQLGSVAYDIKKTGIEIKFAKTI